MDEMARAIPVVHGWIAIAGMVLTAGLIVYGRVSALVLQRRHAAAVPRTLSEAELGRLRRWGRRDVAGFVMTIAALVAYSILVSLPFVPPAAIVAGYAGVIGLAVAMLGHHFLERCPSCGRSVGLQSGLGLPAVCELCQVAFRPVAGLARAVGLRAETRYVSATRLLGLPLLAMATGADPATGETRGVAKGWIALGDVAIGVVAIGGTACGVIAIGGVGLGLVSIAGIAVGACALGGLALGGLALGGVAAGALAFGGVAIGHTAVGGLALGVHARGARVLLLGSR